MHNETTIAMLEHAAQISLGAGGSFAGRASCDGIECRVKRIYPKCGERVSKVHLRFTFKHNGKRITRAQAIEVAE